MTFANHKKALITGASAGLGREFALQIARQGTDVVLVARRQDKLKELAEEVKKLGVMAEVITCDLEKANERARLKTVIESTGVDLLINNAGFGKIGRFTDIPLDFQLGQVELNIKALVELSYYAAPAFKANGFGTIVNIASTASFIAMPNFAVYAASKKFVRDFTEALAFEMKGTGVRACAVCPGPTETEFFEVAGSADKLKIGMMRTDVAVSEALQGIARGDVRIVLGVSNKALAAATRVLPDSLSMNIAAMLTKP
ncbi:SDR family oxidoreductase [bacterium]|nr:SDR family oxidoreductase [bacterium]